MEIMAFVTFVIACGLNWVAVAGAMRLQNDLCASSPEYAEKLYRTNPLKIFLMKGPVRVLTLVFAKPPVEWEGGLRNLRRMAAAGFFLVAVSLILFWMGGR